MADAELERTTISVCIDNKKEKFVAVGEVITFDGFLQVYRESYDDDNDKEQDKENGLLPPVELHEVLTLNDIVATERFTTSAALYGSQPCPPSGRTGYRSSFYLCADYSDDPVVNMW